MSDVDVKDEESVELSLHFKLEKIYKKYGLRTRTDNLKMKFSDLFEQLSKKGKVAVLIDEYDKPILEHLDNPDKAEKIRDILRSFYSTLKDADPYLEFVLLTGITKFTKTGVFSTLNNLNDISAWDEFSQMMGYTQEELEKYFDVYIDIGMKKMNNKREALLEDIKNYYNGFSFDGKNFIYNPFSILNFFQKYEFDNYWVESGSPSFLVNYVKKHKIEIDKILGNYMQKDYLISYEIESAPPMSFLVQAGYLTFKDYDRELGYLIDYPNIEVGSSFSKLLMISGYGIDIDKNDGINRNIIMALRNKNFEILYEQMKIVFSSIPYNLYTNRESYYHSVILTMLFSTGTNVRAEELNNLGRSDIVLSYNDDVYIIELKKAPPETSIKQIKAKNYAGKYKNKTLHYVGIEIDEENHNLKGYKIESYKKSEI